MKCKRETVTAVTTLFAALAMPVCMAAQDNPKPEDKANHRRYRLVDLGTFGGPSSTFQNPLARVLTNSGTAVGGADTAKPDPSHPCVNPFAASDCFIQHAFRWPSGTLTDLGALPGGNFSLPRWFAEGGQIAGGSENGLTDPLTGAPEIRAVLWNDRNITDLGTLGGTQSLAIAVNKHGQVIGASNNSVPDPFSVAAVVDAFPSTTQTRAFLWQQGRGMQDLGTLGGPDAFAQFVNDRGQVAGFSYTTGTPDPNTGIPPVHPFLWEDGKMVDIGTLGGAFGLVDDLNNRGQVVGPMDLAGDQTFHPYLWEHGKLSDLGTFGGSNG